MNSETQLRPIWRWELTAAAVLLLLIACVVAITIGPVSLSAIEIIKTLLGQDSSLTEQERALLLEIRLPRVALAALVGAALATSGATYQTVFRNPLADPYLLGAAGGAGLARQSQLQEAIRHLPLHFQSLLFSAEYWQ